MLRQFMNYVFIPIMVFALVFVAISPVRAAGPDSFNVNNTQQAAGSPAVTSLSGPDFTNVNDILVGRRMLFPVDDVVVAQGGAVPVVTTILPTLNGNPQSPQFPFTIPGTALQTFMTASARMFNLDHDVVVTVLEGETDLVDKVAGINQSFPNPIDGISPGSINLFAVADFTGNGFEGVAFLNTLTNTLNAMTAADTNQETQGIGFFYSTPASLPSGCGAPYALAAGDFSGDGVNEIAVACTIGSNIVVSVYRPQATLNADGNQVTSLALQQVGSTGSIPFTDGTNGNLALTAGAYGGLANANLLLAYTTGFTIVLQPIKLTPTTPNQPLLTMTATTPLNLSQDGSGSLFAKSGYLDFFNNAVQVVLDVEAKGINVPRTIDLLTLDNALNVTVSSFSTAGAFDGLVQSIALGNFDQSITAGDPINLEIAELSKVPCGSGGGLYNLVVTIYQTRPTLSAVSSTLVGAGPNFCYNNLGILYTGLTTGDTQGRSLKLGAVSKLTVQHIQPQVILEAPPMHVDFVTPESGTGQTVLNMSADPGGFFASYQTAVTNKKESTQQGTTSYTAGIKASASAGVSIGDPLVGSISASVKASVSSMHKNFVQKQYGQYSSTQFTAATATGFDDQVWFTSEEHNIYIYPVIGQSACSSSSTTCTDAEKQPLVIMFSGPSQQTQISTGGSNLEWYQPVQEVGNIFSYPWDVGQLGNIKQLSDAPTAFSTDQSTLTEQATWHNQNQSSVTTGNTSNISWGTSVSLTEKAGIFGGITGSQDFAYNHSTSVSTLNTQTTILGQSTGIGIVKPGTFRPDFSAYEYLISPYIFGDNPLLQGLQTINLPTAIQSQGVLGTGYTVNLNNQNVGVGPYWQGGPYANPDVGVAHEVRWSLSTQNPIGTNNCIQVNNTSSNKTCAKFNGFDPTSTDIWHSHFYWMKGLLITPADQTNPAGVGNGPQIQTITAGKDVLLQARVYNNSLLDTPDGDTLVVQIYGEPWDNETYLSKGGAFLIGEVDLNGNPALYGYNTATNPNNTPNSTLVSVTFSNTADYADQYLAFWVLVYLKDAGGNLVPELTGHGLTGIPPTPPTLNSITDVTKYLEQYSNNIGFYKSLFYVKPNGTLTLAAPNQAGLTMDNVKVSAKHALLGQNVTISGLVHAQKEMDGMSIMFLDGNPNKGGTIFDVDGISHIRANDSHLISTVYQPNSCGKHKLYVQGLEATVGGIATVDVTMDVNPPLDQLTEMIGSLIPRSKRHDNSLLHDLREAREAFNANHRELGLDLLQDFRKGVKRLQGKQIPTDQADTMLAILGQIFACERFINVDHR